MSNSFAGFVHTSPLSSLLHDPVVSLASHCIRDAFGPTVQTVADCLQTRGGALTLAQLTNFIQTACRRVWNEERQLLVGDKRPRARGPASSGHVVDAASIRAALLILIQHDIVQVVQKSTTVVAYQLDIRRARLLSRHARFVEYAKKALDETAAALVQELLLNGRIKTVDAVVLTVNQLQQVGATTSERHTHCQAVVEAFRRLVAGGFIEQVPDLTIVEDDDDDDDDEWQEPVTKRVKFNKQDENDVDDDDDPAVVQLLSSPPYNSVLILNVIWRVNEAMFHDSIRAFCLGRLVAERFGHKIQASGSIVTAALKLTAHKQHARQVRTTSFVPNEIVPFLPKAVQQMMEKKPGGMLPSLSRSLVELSRMTYPVVVDQVEDAAGHAHGGRFSIALHDLVDHLQGRVTHQMLYDSHGELAARVCSILRVQGHLESDTIAEAAMIPAKDTREILHRLYQHNYVSLFLLNQSKQHNPSSMIYLWSVSPARLVTVVRDNVCKVLINMRLRRQHEVEVGKEWIERAKEAGAMDENDHEVDKKNYNKFCQGLERLDNAILQLDETMMVLFDFT